MRTLTDSGQSAQGVGAGSRSSSRARESLGTLAGVLAEDRVDAALSGRPAASIDEIRVDIQL